MAGNMPVYSQIRPALSLLKKLLYTHIQETHASFAKTCKLLNYQVVHGRLMIALVVPHSMSYYFSLYIFFLIKQQYEMHSVLE